MINEFILAVNLLLDNGAAVTKNPRNDYYEVREGGKSGLSISVYRWPDFIEFCVADRGCKKYGDGLSIFKEVDRLLERLETEYNDDLIWPVRKYIKEHKK